MVASEPDWYGNSEIGPCPYDDCNGTRVKHNSSDTPPTCTTESCTECSAGRDIDQTHFERPEDRHRRYQQQRQLR